MSVLAAACIATCAYLAVGLTNGASIRIQFPRRSAGNRAGQRRAWPQQAGLALSPGQFWAGSIGAGVATFVLLTALVGTPLVAVVPAIAVAALPHAYFGRRRAARLREVQAAWPDGLRDVIASIAAGRSLTQALTTLATIGPVPLREALARFPTLAPVLGTVPALELLREELADPTSDRVIEVLALAHERGGPIVREILEDLVVATTRDLKMVDEIETAGLEMKINARAVLVLPWLVLVALTIRPGPFREFYDSSAGLLVVMVAGALSAVGYAWIRRLGRTETERRVLGASRPRPVGELPGEAS